MQHDSLALFHAQDNKVVVAVLIEEEGAEELAGTAAPGPPHSTHTSAAGTFGTLAGTRLWAPLPLKARDLSRLLLC